MSALPCLSENTIAAFIDDQLPREQVERVTHHMDECPACLTLVVGAIQDSHDAGRTPSALASTVPIIGLQDDDAEGPCLPSVSNAPTLPLPGDDGGRPFRQFLPPAQ